MLLASCSDDISAPAGIKTDSYNMTVPSCVPIVEISIDNDEEVVEKDTYLRMNAVIKENGEVTLSAPGKIKGRGNYTWNYPKKPYKIKFDDKQSVSAYPENKDWVLLADYCDKSFMRTAYMCEISAALDVNYPIRYRHVQLYINGTYRGLYILADQVEKKKNRVDIEDDGYLFENDNYAWAESLMFVTELRGYPFSFKHPDPDDGEIAEGEENFEYIVDFMNEFERALYSDDYLDSEKGYRKYVDLESFAKWFIVAELTANHDPNMYYVIPKRGAPLQTGPMWDAEYSLGISYRWGPTDGWGVPPRKPDVEQKIWSRWKYFARMFDDPFFTYAVKQEWAAFEKRVPQIKTKMEKVAANIKDAQKENFELWQIMGTLQGAAIICFDTWEEEVDYAADFFDKRVEWLDGFINGLI